MLLVLPILGEALPKQEVGVNTPVCSSDFWGAATRCEDKGGYCAEAGGSCEVLSAPFGSCYCQLPRPVCGKYKADELGGYCSKDLGCSDLGGQCEGSEVGEFCQCKVPI